MKERNILFSGEMPLATLEGWKTQTRRIIKSRECRQIVEILSRRANEIAHYSGEHRDKVPGSVDLALEGEIKRLRSLADKVLTGIKEDEDEDDSK